MSNRQKYTISLVLFCIVSSVLISLLTVSLFMNRGINNTMTQTMIINEKPERLVNLNNCTKHELLDLPGIGETIADKIIENRPYDNPWELLDIPGIGTKTFQNIIERVEV